MIFWFLLLVSGIAVLYFFRSRKQFEVDFFYRSLPSIAGISTSSLDKSINSWKNTGSEIIKEISGRGRKTEESTASAIISEYWQVLKSELDKQTSEAKRVLILKGLEKLGYREAKLEGEDNPAIMPCVCKP